MKKAKFFIVAMLVIMMVSVFALCACNPQDNDGDAIGSVSVQYVADGQAAMALLNAGSVDFIVVGEPAATQFTTRLSLNAEMNMQTAYTAISGKQNYPQAGLFVRKDLAGNQAFMSELFLALANSKAWAVENKAEVTAFAQQYLYESATFPAASIDRCQIDGTALNDTSKQEIVDFLKSVMPTDSNANEIDWDGAQTSLFGVGSGSYTSSKLRFAAPEGTPALAILRLPADNATIGGYEIEYEVVKPANISAEMATNKADIVIMPINAGANLVNKGADYTLVSTAVGGSLFMVGNTQSGGEITAQDLVDKKIACIGQAAVPGLVFRYVMAGLNLNVIAE